MSPRRDSGLLRRGACHRAALRADPLAPRNDELDWRLLLRQREREFAVAHARRNPLDEFRDRVLAIGTDQFGECREQARLREAVAVDAVMARFRPGLVEIAERGLLLLVVGQRVAGEG